MTEIIIAFKVTENDRVICQGSLKTALLKGKSAKDMMRDWNAFLMQEYKNREIKVWWMPALMAVED